MPYAGKSKVNYLNMNDEEVLSYVHSGCKRGMGHLIEKYKPLVRLRRSYFLVGADREDIVQEGMIGLFKVFAITNMIKIPFKVFAEICITRQIITAVKTATRQKHMPLNTYVSLNRKVFDEDSDKSLIELVQEVSIADPEELLINKRSIRLLSMVTELLSPFERKY